jgi:hypothetical protein
MESGANRWYLDRQLHVDAFALVNLGFLIFDIYLAHSTNAFRRPVEWAPLYFSLFASAALAVAIFVRVRLGSRQAWNDLGHFVGGVAIVVGITGVVLHLDSQFFWEKTLRSLTYAAPFAAPLAYTGLGLLIIMNRLVRPESVEWAEWILMLTLAGFFGNFVLSLTDHASNGFFNPVEWLPVISAAVAFAFLLTPFLVRVTRQFLRLIAGVLAGQILIGVIGFAYHVWGNLHGTSGTVFENTVFGAPPFAPMLFPNLAILGLYGLWRYREFLPEDPITHPQTD